MKILNKLFFIIVVIVLGGCSNSDNTDTSDPVYDLEYKPLQSFEELGTKVYSYEGIKVEGRKSSMLSPTSTGCNKYDFLQVFFENDKLSKIVYSRMARGCSGRETVELEKNILFSEGILHTKITGSVDNLTPLYVDSEKRIQLEIGFQGDYLRIEDRMSLFSRTKKNEKVYLYFKEK